MEPRDPAEWTDRVKELRALHEWVGENLERAYQKQSTYYNLRHRDVVFEIGDLVLKRQHVLSSAAHNVAAKLAPKFHGPFRVSRVLSPVVYELVELNGRGIGKAHAKDLKPYHPPVPRP